MEESTITVSLNLKENKTRFGIPCLVCEETSFITDSYEELEFRAHDLRNHLCEKCRIAILSIREKN